MTGAVFVARLQAVHRTPLGLRANASLALVADLVSKVALFAVVVVSAHALSTAQFASFGVCLAAGTVVGGILDAGFSTLIVREGARAAATRGALVRASTLARLPLVLVALASAVTFGLATGETREALAVVAFGVASAISLTILAIFRSAQNLAFEVSQKLAAAVISSAAAVILALDVGRAWAVLAALAFGLGVTLPVLWRSARPLLAGGVAIGPRAAVRQAVPFGAMALGTLFYYRAPVLVLGLLGSSGATAAFTVASTVAFGLLALPNALTTGLLPRLAACSDPAQRRTTERRGLAFALALCGGAAALTGVAMYLLGPAVFGARFNGAFPPLVILLVATIPIGVSGILGTALIAARRGAPVVEQVVAASVINVALAFLLIPSYGATGAAVATLVTEAVAVGWLGWAKRDLVVVPLLLRRIGLLRPAIGACLGGLVALQAWAVSSGYGLRVISDSPTYLALLPRMAAHPFQPLEPFMPGLRHGDPHDSPYTQALASSFAYFHGDTFDPSSLARYLGIIGIGVTLLLLHACFLWFRSISGSRAAWIALPAMLVLFGPAEVIWAGDFTFHGFLYSGYFPQTVAMALALYALVLVERSPNWLTNLAGVALVAATMTTHPFTGLLLAVLLLVRGATAAAAGRAGWETGGWWLAGGFAVSLAWPAYSVSAALGESGVPGPLLIGFCALGPCVCHVLPRAERVRRSTTRLVGFFESIRIETALVVVGTATVVVLAVWELVLFTQSNPDPLIHSNRLSLYWVEDRWRWPLMFAAGAVGLVGLARLARARKPLPLVWFLGCYAAGVAGVVGLPLPVWWRLLLFCQIPLALGVGTWFDKRWFDSATSRRAIRSVAAFTLVGVAVFKIATLLLAPTSITYFNTPVQSAWALDRVVPRAPGVVASDPFTSYFVPGATGHLVLVVTKAHVSSPAELDRATHAYQLLHRFYMGDAWWSAAQTMYREGVRYVLIEKSTSLRPPTLVTFSTGPTPLIRTARDRRLLGTYYYRNGRVGTLLYDRAPYVLFRLDAKKLFG